MTIKGYVVRGQDRQLRGADVWATADGVGMKRERAKLYDVAAAVGAWAELRRCSWCADARILAVTEGGRETPLPTYEEALDEVGQLCAEVNLARERTMAALAEIERLRADLAKAETIRALARRLIQGSDLNTTSGQRAGITCDEEQYAALVDLFEAEREAARLIHGLVCAECDRPIYRGWEYAGKGGHAAHRACRNWPSGTVFKIAGAQEGAAS